MLPLQGIVRQINDVITMFNLKIFTQVKMLSENLDLILTNAQI